MASYFTFEPDLGIFAKQLNQLGVHIPWIGSAANISTTALRLAGPALYDTYGVVDFNSDSCPTAKSFTASYEAMYKVRPDHLSGWPYDAMHVLALAINSTKSLDPQKIRQALVAIKNYPGAEGTYNFDQNGDGLHGYNVVKNVNGQIMFEKHIEFKN